jgi:hypothetical protein
MNRRLWLAIIITAAAICHHSAESYGQTLPTNAIQSGDWFAPGTWDAGVPSFTKPAAINGGWTVTVNADGGQTNVLDVGSIPNETGTLQFTSGVFDLIDTDAVTGPNATTLRLGQAAGSTGIMNMSGGDIAISEDITDAFDSGDLTVGQFGTGTLNMTGGLITAADEFFIGQWEGSNGTVNFSGGEIQVTRRSVQVGFAVAANNLPGGHGELNVSGTAKLSGNSFIFVGFDPGSSGIITQTGGTVTTTGLLIVGTRGTGTYNHSAGVSHAFLGIVGDNFAGPTGPNAGSHGVYNLSGSGKLDTDVVTWVGNEAGGNGVFNQSGGTAELGALMLGRRGIGYVNLSGGSLTVKGTDGYTPANHLILGMNENGSFDSNITQGEGYFTQTGGTITVKTGVFLGDYDSSDGTYKISGGTLNVVGGGAHQNPEDYEDFIGDFSVGGALASNARTSRVNPTSTTDPQGQALDANGTFIVSGSAATINIAGNFLANPADKHANRKNNISDTNRDNSATLGFEIFDISGTSLINVGGVADLDGAVIDMDLMSGYVPPVNTVFSLLKASSFGATGTGTTQNIGTGEGFSLATEDVGSWTLAVVAGVGFETLQATFIGPAFKNGDFNNDGSVDGTDLLAWQRGLGITTGATKSQGDGDANGAVNAVDLGIWKTDFNSPAVAAVGAAPEPSTACLVILAIVAATGASRTATRSGRRDA